MGKICYQGVEDEKHFLIDYIFYEQERKELLRETNSIGNDWDSDKRIIWFLNPSNKNLDKIKQFIRKCVLKRQDELDKWNSYQ